MDDTHMTNEGNSIASEQRRDVGSETPPAIAPTYSREKALQDLPPMVYAMELFLASYMVRCEKFCEKADPTRTRLYLTTGHGLVQTIKSFMTYADEDILSAMEHTKTGALVANEHRKKSGITSRLSGLTSSLTSAFTGGEGSDIAWIRSMTAVERHAELMYAENLAEKAMLGVLYSGDWLAFIKEALNMRAAIHIYRSLFRFLQIADAAWQASHPNEKEDPSLDAHFRSGIYLGYGTSTLILSLLPSKLQSVVELFGYHASRADGLEVLERAGGWGGKSADDETSPPLVDKDAEGVRRPICDMVLLSFHLVISSFTTVGVSIPKAFRLIKYYTDRFPRGVFFLFARGRMALLQSRPADAIELHRTALQVLTEMEDEPSESQIEEKEAHNQFTRLAAISYWESANAYLALYDVDKSNEQWRHLHERGGWSKAVYAYGYAATAWELNRGKDDEQSKAETAKAVALLKTVPDLRQKIAGKSIPLEKLVARKARKFTLQGTSLWSTCPSRPHCHSENYLTLPALEIGYWFLAISHAPMDVLGRMLKDVEATLKELEAESAAQKRQGYWDDICLARFLEGVCLRYVAFPVSDVNADPVTPSEKSIPGADAAKRAEASFKSVFEHGTKVQYDHYVVYYAHYELGRLLACQNRTKEAGEQFELVLSGKYLEVGPSGRKGRYSLENALHMKARAATEVLGK
ncbi:hypothetical protein CYLTODRAFT_397404 [Cylindrobasidium torrendii FP15055 ss-10]|uniref:Uncharacterized protein n=1 Tax=Cylindrobasidium torrendii FP15055 ss-10 TaxID=1314674 RepID=A0A0D7B9T5_9AGAR|nr:hypothetical protein CYLTODRAFT_397404 [Cylindrobasidium torrendii FP15055 ss-10]